VSDPPDVPARRLLCDTVSCWPNCWGRNLSLAGRRPLLCVALLPCLPGDLVSP
jgi:hypothetical protein